MSMVRSQKSFGGVARIASGNVPYKIGDRTLLPDRTVLYRVQLESLGGDRSGWKTITVLSSKNAGFPGVNLAYGDV